MEPPLFDPAFVGGDPRDALRFLANVLQSSTDCALVANGLDGTILLWNEGARRLYGYAAEGVLGKAPVGPPDLAIRADRRALSQVLLNLTSNAITFTDRGRVCLRAERRHEDGRAVTAFSVADTDIGIRAEDQARLLQAFTQVDVPRRQRSEGTGLGLHLSRKLAELLGGSITLRSEPGRGSTFTLVLAEG